MDNTELNNSENNKKNIILILIAVITLFLSIYLFYLGRKPVVVNTTKYKENASVSYDIYYGSEKVNYNTLVRNYLTKVEANFIFQLDSNKDIKGKLLYTTEAYWYAYNTGYKNEKIYISSIETLSPTAEKNYENTKNINAEAMVSVDYNKYLQSYLAYKKSSKVSSQAVIVVEYKIFNNIISNNIDTKEDEVVTLEIPLSEDTFKIRKQTTINNKYKYINEVNKKSIKSKIELASSIILLIISIICLIILIIYYIKESKNIDSYKKNINKILNSYDNIIVEIENIPDVTGKTIIRVKSFEELLDAQIQASMPINFKEDITKSIFLVISSDIAWIYELNK